ncbi:MAG: tetratricopeptide repeat protein, partial [Flavobacteriales bacterium]
MNKYFYILFPIILIFCACQNDLPNEIHSEVEEPVNKDLAQLNQNILDSPNELAPYLERANYYASRNMGENALADYDRALRIDSTNTDVLFAKGELLFGHRDVESAFDMYKKCIVSDPNNIPCLLKNAEMNVHLRQYAIALEQINSALK